MRAPKDYSIDGASARSPITKETILRDLSPWLALAALWLLFELPLALQSTTPNLSALRLSLEVPLLMTLWGLHRTVAPGRALRWLLGIATGLLVFLQVDTWLCLFLMNQEALLYDQWFMLRHLFVLFSDLLYLQNAPWLLILPAGIFAIVWVTRWLLRRSSALFEPERRRRTGRVAIALWAVLLAGAVAQGAFGGSALRFRTAAVVENAAESYRVYRGIQDRVMSTAYAAYDDMTLRPQPDVLLFVVESYGRLLFNDAAMRGPHLGLLDELSSSLAASGWHAASAYSTAPVSGGRSWIAVGAMLMGVQVQHQAVFQHLVAQNAPNLVGFFNKQGYETLMVAPVVRARPGVRMINRYDHSTLLAYGDLGYRGPEIGWGRIPDQYSLAVADARVLRPSPRPVFMEFHMVSSHGPWSDVPELLDHIAVPETEQRSEPVTVRHTNRAVLSQLERYEREDEHRYPHVGTFEGTMQQAYQGTVSYDLRLIAQYLERREEDALVVVIGDHQPPVIVSSDMSFETPVHVFSRSPEMIEPLRDVGFSEGLRLAAEAPPAMSHAGMFSLVVRALQSVGCHGCALQPILPQGDRVLKD